MSTTHAKTNPEELIANHHVSSTLRHLAFVYTNKELLEVMDMLINKYGAEWNPKTEHKAIYRTTMAMRLRCIMIKTGYSVEKERTSNVGKTIEMDDRRARSQHHERQDVEQR